MLRQAFEEHQAVVSASLAAIEPSFDAVLDRLVAGLQAGGRVLAFGNGGSAAQASHFAAELTGRFEEDRPGFDAVALSADAAALTSVANDYGFDQVFARQVAALGRRGDVVVAISTSGTSANVVEGVRAAAAAGLVTAALTGEGGGALAPLVDHLIAVPSLRTARVQEVHAIVLHELAREVEARAVRRER